MTPDPQPPSDASASPPAGAPAPAPPADDPLVVEYADSLKSKLGSNYDPDLDKLPLKQRIETMKAIHNAFARANAAKKDEKKETQEKPETKPPQPPLEIQKPKIKTHVELAQEGYDPFAKPSRTSAFSIVKGKD